MTSPLAGSLAATINKAMGGLFLSATLTRGASVYPCRAIFETWGKASGPGGALESEDVKALVLAGSLVVEPDAGDVVSLQGTTFVVVSNNDNRPAVSTDPARATWSLIGKFVPVGSGVLAAYAATAAALGSPYTVYRSTASNPLATTPVETTPVIVTSARSSGFDFKRSSTFEDLLFTMQADFSNIQIGDYLVGPGGTYFIADMPALRPVAAVQCNRVATLTRPNSERNVAGGQAVGLPSQPGGAGVYRALSQAVTVSGAGEAVVKAGIPCAMIGTMGRATGGGELPSDAPGPSRWRVYLPRGAFPKGSVEDRDVVADEEGNRHLVSAASWTAIGYRLEAVRMES